MLDEKDIKIEAWPPRDKGGQHVSTGPSGVKITHELYGLVAAVNCGRSQFHNREIAMDMILTALTPEVQGLGWLRCRVPS